jgi:hypothetical protein
VQPTGAPASELETLRMHFSGIFFYLNMSVFLLYLIRIFKVDLCILSLIRFKDRPTCNEPPLDTCKFATHRQEMHINNLPNTAL